MRTIWQESISILLLANHLLAYQDRTKETERYTNLKLCKQAPDYKTTTKYRMGHQSDVLKNHQCINRFAHVYWLRKQYLLDEFDGALYV